MKAYIVVETNLDYNDEIYYEKGFLVPSHVAYKTEDEARAIAKVKLREIFDVTNILNPSGKEVDYSYGLRIGDLVYDRPNELFPMFGEYKDSGGEESDFVGSYIEWLENKDIDWVKCVPEFVRVQEIVIND